jgi:hypothetical protein
VEVPAFLTTYGAEDRSLDTVKDYRLVPRLKVVQSTSRQELKDDFGEGAVVIMPGNQLAFSRGGSTALFVPVFFYAEFCTWSDIDDVGSPGVVARSFDPTCDIAKKARSQKLRFEIYPGEESKQEPKRYRHVEHMRFPGVLVGDHALAGTACVLSFERGEFSTGQGVATSISMRKVVLPDGTKISVPLWAQIWELSCDLRQRGQKKWFGIDAKVPTEGPSIIDNKDAEMFKSLHEEMKEAYDAKKLLTEDEDRDLEREPVPVSSSNADPTQF